MKGKYICPWTNTGLGCSNACPCDNCILVQPQEEPPMFSIEYLEWAKKTGQKGLTSTQHEFAEWLFKNKGTITQIGNLKPIFISVYQWLKYNAK